MKGAFEQLTRQMTGAGARSGLSALVNDLRDTENGYLSDRHCATRRRVVQKNLLAKSLAVEFIQANALHHAGQRSPLQHTIFVAEFNARVAHYRKTGYL